MGNESGEGAVTIYLDGEPVEITEPLPEITISEVKEAIGVQMANLCKKLEGEMRMPGSAVGQFLRESELSMAILCADLMGLEMAGRYRRAKKKRIRKKYEKRLRAWFRGWRYTEI